MADETKTTQNPVTAEAPAGEAPSSSGKKTKKINRMDLKELTSKIESLESNKMAGSIYHRHLLQRKAELERPPQV